MKFLDNYKYFIGTFLCFVSIFIFNLWENYPLYSTELFEDWKYIYNYHSCFNNTGIKEIDCTLILKSRFVYPEIWLKILDISYPIFENIIYLFIGTYFLITFKFFDKSLRIYHFLFLFSPTSILLVQRGNNELLIFLLIFIFMKLFNSKKFRLLSIFPFILSGLLKIFPFCLFIIYFIHDIKKINYIKIIILIASLILFSFFIEEYLDIKKNFPLSHGKVTLVYGADSIFYIVTLIIKNINFNYQKLSIVALIILIIFSFMFKIKNIKKINSTNDISFLIGSTILISSFFINASFEYRFIYIVLTLPFLFDLKKTSKNKIFFYFILLIYLVLWFEFIIYYIKEIIEFDKIKTLNEHIINLNTVTLGFLIILKNLIYWIINFGLILIAKDIFFNKFTKIKHGKKKIFSLFYKINIK